MGSNQTLKDPLLALLISHRPDAARSTTKASSMPVSDRNLFQDLIGSLKTVEPKCNQISHSHLAVSASAKVMLKVLR